MFFEKSSPPERIFLAFPTVSHIVSLPQPRFFLSIFSAYNFNTVMGDLCRQPIFVEKVSERISLW